jgi:hypothetical protein
MENREICKNRQRLSPAIRLWRAIVADNRNNVNSIADYVSDEGSTKSFRVAAIMISVLKCVQRENCSWIVRICENWAICGELRRTRELYLNLLASSCSVFVRTDMQAFDRKLLAPVPEFCEPGSLEKSEGSILAGTLEMIMPSDQR